MNTDQGMVSNGLLMLSGAAHMTSRRVPVGSPEWYAWLATERRFVFEGGTGRFLAQRERRRNGSYWYAYRRQGGKLYKRYLGSSEALTLAYLEQAATRLAGSRSWAGASDETLALLISTPAEADAGGAATEQALLPATKIMPPALLESVLERPRLIRRIRTPVTVVCAPGGFGKSTLLSAWRQTCGFPVAWVSLDADDNQITRFWFTVRTALRTIHPRLGDAWASQEDEHVFSSHDPANSALRLADNLTRATDGSDARQRYGLVLDDYHHIRHPEVHAALQLFLEQLPPGLHLMIASRSLLPLAWGGLRASGKVTEIDAEELRFTLDEGVAMLQQAAPERLLSSTTMARLVQRSEGWAVGLRLAGIALAQAQDPQHLLTTFTGAHAYLREYFTETVLHRQPLPVQTFLLKTALLQQFTADLCDAVTGNTDGVAMIARLERDNVYLVPLEEPGWYRYHELFAEMLISQVQALVPDEEVVEVHRRAAVWYRAHQLSADAVRHLLASQAWEEAAAIIERMALQELAHVGEDSRLLGWLSQLPEQVVQHHATLLGVYIRLAGLAVLPSEVAAFLARVEANIARKPAGERTPNEREVLADIRHLWGIERADHTDAHIPLGAQQDVWRLLDGILQYQPAHCPDVQYAAELAREVYRAAQTQQNLFATMMAGGALASFASVQGHLRDSEHIARQVLREALTQRGTLPGPASIALSVLGRVCFYRNQLAEAQHFLRRAAEVDPHPTSSNMPVTLAVRRALLEWAKGKGEAAQATLREARHLLIGRPSGLWREQDVIAYQALIQVRRGDGDGAERLLSEIPDADTHGLSLLVRAELLLQRQQYASGEALLKFLLRKYPHGMWQEQEPVLGARILLASTLLAQRQLPAARQLIVAAIREAAPEGFCRPFLDHARHSKALLTLARETATLPQETHAWVQDVLRLIGRTAEGADLPPGEMQALTIAATISAREHEVLLLVSKGLSNQSIATQLSLAASTVKSHLDTIYRKLGVHSRTQALTAARALRIISD